MASKMYLLACEAALLVLLLAYASNYHAARGAWHQLRLETNGNSLALYNDGERMAWATNSLHILIGLNMRRRQP